MSTNGNKPELVNILIDGKPVSVPKGTNLIEAARSIGIEIPHYCYHPHLSIAGNCRMCQVEVKGAPKMEIACNTVVKEGMEVLTQEASAKAKDAQAATLEFILINHPLDCTVCDQAGHCKLQDYHYEYNARPSRFLEDKVHKVKAEPLGPTVILDGERCIMCTRCIRFCDEVTGTSELGMLNRGDRSVIAINPGRELNNPLSGTVVDLCPVGALTHRDWRFNTRIWFTKQVDTICPGCSTGCNAKAAVRDQQVVQVKARMNDKVNKEWMCDEGRYGFHRFLPEKRIISPLVEGKAVSREEALKAVKGLAGDDLLVLLSPDLMLEDYVRIKGFLDKSFKSYTSAVAYRERKLTPVEAILISPDYACNFRGAVFAGLAAGNLEQSYNEALQGLVNGKFSRVLMVGDRSIIANDQKSEVLHAISKAQCSVGIFTDAESPLASAAKIILPGRSILEKSGMLINRRNRLQYAQQLLDFPESSDPEWRIVTRLAEAFGNKLGDAVADREATFETIKGDTRLAGLTIKRIKDGGVDLEAISAKAAESEAAAEARV